jgi:Mg-chelatase subunit ChlD
MSALINALDLSTPRKLGENGHIELRWSKDIQESIIQLFFQIVRVPKNQVTKIQAKTQEILKKLVTKYKMNHITLPQYQLYLTIMYKLIAQTRDIVEGKGEYEIGYAMLNAWEEENMYGLAEYMFQHFLMPPAESPTSHPLGSWKDMKYYYLRYPRSALVDASIKWACSQLQKDTTAQSPSLAAKWIPRQQNKKYNELYTRLSSAFYPHYLITAKTTEQQQKALLKAKTHFRKLVSEINKKLDTVQIKQCGHQWAEIEPSKQTSITMHLQKKAFLNLKKNSRQRSFEEDRIQCAENFKQFIEKTKKEGIEIKGKRIGLNNFTKEAIELNNSSSNELEKDILNAQWVSNRSQSQKLGKFIAMVDVSGSMRGDPLHAAIALGIRVAEMSEFGKRVLTFSKNPHWVNLEDSEHFTDMVRILENADWGMNTDFYAAMHLILDVIIEKRLPAEEVEDMVLVIFSDMQIDDAYENNNSHLTMHQKIEELVEDMTSVLFSDMQIDAAYKNNNSRLTMHQKIEELYARTGIQICGTPYKPPHILFWNLRYTEGFPSLSSTPNVSMMSGFSPALLNNFCEMGLEALQNTTPWDMLVDTLNKQQYQHFEDKVADYIS